jgi:serine/threonine-protein kinase
MQYVFRNIWRQLVAFVIFTLALVLLLDKVIMPIYVRHGKEEKLPDVRKRSAIKAKEVLEDRGFEVEIVDTVEVSGVPQGIVIDQQPAPGTLVKVGRVVRLMVTGGRKYFPMPNLVGQVYKAAALTLEHARLELAEVEYVFSSDKPEGVVCEQSVLPGSMVSAGTPVSLKVSKGKPEHQYTVPRVVGMSLNDAKQEIRQAGLKVGLIRYVPNADLNPHTVIDQTPKPGRIYDNPINVDLQVTVEP